MILANVFRSSGSFLSVKMKISNRKEDYALQYSTNQSRAVNTYGQLHLNANRMIEN